MGISDDDSVKDSDSGNDEQVSNSHSDDASTDTQSVESLADPELVEKPQYNFDLEYNNFGEKLTKQLFVKKQKIICKIWAYPNGIEVCIAKRTVKLGVQQFEYKNRVFNIDYSAIQQDLGILVFNVHFNNAVGALRFQKPLKDVDSKNAKEMLQRGILTALWGSWKMPLFIALIAVAGLIVMATVFATILPRYLALNDENSSMRQQLEAYQQAGIPVPIIKKPTAENGGSK